MNKQHFINILNRKLFICLTSFPLCKSWICSREVDPALILYFPVPQAENTAAIKHQLPISPLVSSVGNSHRHKSEQTARGRGRRKGEEPVFAGWRKVEFFTLSNLAKDRQTDRQRERERERQITFSHSLKTRVLPRLRWTLFPGRLNKKREGGISRGI